jgi:hypothetical protein
VAKAAAFFIVCQNTQKGRGSLSQKYERERSDGRYAPVRIVDLTVEVAVKDAQSSVRDQSRELTHQYSSEAFHLRLKMLLPNVVERACG